MKVLFIYPNEMMLNPPPVSIGILNAVLKDAGFEVALFDTTFYPTFSQTSDKAKETNLQVRPFDYGERGVSLKETDLFDDLQNKLEAFLPDLIAISILEPTFSQSLSLLDIIHDYNIPVVAGGVFPTFAPDRVLSHPAVDIVCIGEGEGPLLELCESMRNDRDISQIKNLLIRRNSRIIRNRIRPVVDLDELPLPNYDLFETERFYRPMAGHVYRAIPVETNRGCPYQCSYCNSPSQSKLYLEHGAGNFFRKKSMARIEEELRHLIPLYNAEYVYFTSDTFLSMTGREFEQFIEMYSEFRLPFWVQTRPETITKEKAIALKKIGCHRMSLGVEHGNYEFRKKVLKKNIPDRIIIEACDAIAETGIPLTINNIIGFPGETRELVFDTIKLNRRLKFDTSNAYAFSPFHGTPLHEVCLKNGLISENRTVNNLTIDAALDMPDLSREEIEGLRKTFALYARLSKEFWPQIKVAEGNDEQARQAFEKLRKIYIETYF
ncbi:B12-binding domain-containing radical SAM protein [Thermodesulfobacteriota bacterium]